MAIRQSVESSFKQRIKLAFIDVFNSPVGRPAKKAIITVAGTIVLLLGIALIVLPGPASLLIPAGLAILSLEYPSARKWLRKFQQFLTLSAKKADDWLAKFRNRRAS